MALSKQALAQMRALQRLEGAVVEEYNPFAYVVRTPSPSVNFTFGKSHGLPLGYTLVMYGPPKGGKSVLCNATIGQLHQDDPEAVVVKFNTELRERGQLTAEQAAVWKIDRDRYICYDVNKPDLIFDRIENEIAAHCEAGLKIKLIIIDSITGIQGRRALNADSIMTQQIGDLALTLQEGFKRILPIQRKYNIAIILTAHVRAEMDYAEQQRGNKVKMAAGFGVQHYAEYFMYVEPNKTQEGRTTLLGQKMEDTSVSDMRDPNKSKKAGAERLGHKIRVQMKDSSMGPKNRVGEFTLHYDAGIINTHEEIFTLGVNRNVVERPNNRTYVFGEKKWTDKSAFVQALKDDTDLQRGILEELKRRDLAGGYASMDNLSDKEQERLGLLEGAEESAQEAQASE